MKNQKLKITTTLMLSLSVTLGSYASLAQSTPTTAVTDANAGKATTVVPARIQPQNTNDLVASLRDQRLTENDLGTALAPQNATTSPAQWQPSSDIVTYAAREGVPAAGQGLPDYAMQPYSAVELIEQTLQDRMTMGSGQRIQYFQDQAAQIVAISGHRADEALLRYTLNRSIDVMDHILPIAGNNTEEIQRWVGNFYRRNFELAAAYANNRMGLISVLPLPGEGTLDQTNSMILKNLYVADYGVTYANLLWSFSAGLSSNSSKAVMLMRLLGYLGWDINTDLRRREKPLAETIYDIYRLQHSAAYNNILHSFESDCGGRGCEPQPQDLASLRSQTEQILSKLPARLDAVKVVAGPVN